MKAGDWTLKENGQVNFNWYDMKDFSVSLIDGNNSTNNADKVDI
jgi:hypothetical protein